MEINGRTWVKCGISFSKPVDETNELVDQYEEYYFHVIGDKYLEVIFGARTADVPMFRRDVDDIIHSIQLAEPSDEEGGKADHKGTSEL